MKRGIYEIENLAVLIREGEELPQLSEEAIDLLDTATQNAIECPGWVILPAKAKAALLIAYCVNRLLAYDEGNPTCGYIVELINLLDKRVVDVYPFRDRIPDRILDNRRNTAVTAVTPEDHVMPDYVSQQPEPEGLVLPDYKRMSLQYLAGGQMPGSTFGKPIPPEDPGTWKNDLYRIKASDIPLNQPFGMYFDEPMEDPNLQDGQVIKRDDRHVIVDYNGTFQAKHELGETLLMTWASWSQRPGQKRQERLSEQGTKVSEQEAEEHPPASLVAKLIKHCGSIANHFIGYEQTIWSEGWACKFKLSCQPLGKPYWEFIGAERMTLQEWQDENS